MNGAPERPGQAAETVGLAASWRDARLDDAEILSAIEHRVHTLAHERIEVFREKIALFGKGCRVLMKGEQIVGYGIAHPWRHDDVPPLDRLLGAIPPEAACLFLHDVAILPEARGSGASRAFVEHAVRVAAHSGLLALALVSVYGTEGLWRRHGFIPNPSTATSAQLGPYGRTALYMVRQLS